MTVVINTTVQGALGRWGGKSGDLSGKAVAHFVSYYYKISMQVGLQSLRPPVYYFLPGMQPSAY